MSQYSYSPLSKEDWADINSKSDRTQWDYADLTDWIKDDAQ